MTATVRLTQLFWTAIIFLLKANKKLSVNQSVVSFIDKMRLYRVLILLLMKSYGGGSLFSIMRHDVLETTEQLSQERRYPVLKIDHPSQKFTLFKKQVLKLKKEEIIDFK